MNQFVIGVLIGIPIAIVWFGLAIWLDKKDGNK